MKPIATQLPCEIKRERLFKHLNLNPGAAYAKRVDKMIDEALKVGRPKSVYKVAAIDAKGEDSILIEGNRFTSKVLRINTEDTDKVVAFVATCGHELEEWSENYQDSFSKLCTDGIKGEVLRRAREIFCQKIEEELLWGHTAEMHPGSLPNWPLNEQQPLFSLIGDVDALIGVELSESCLMHPTKSVSGFYFPTQNDYENCCLCLNEECPSRKAPFDKDLYEKKYQLGS
jgi:hypothetical protein